MAPDLGCLQIISKIGNECQSSRFCGDKNREKISEPRTWH